MTAPSLPGRTDPSLSGGTSPSGGGNFSSGGTSSLLGGDSFSLEGDSDGGGVELVCVSDFFSGTDFPVPVACWLPGGGDLLGQQTVDQQSQHTWQLQGREGQ